MTELAKIDAGPSGLLRVQLLQDCGTDGFVLQSKVQEDVSNHWGQLPMADNDAGVTS